MEFSHIIKTLGDDLTFYTVDRLFIQVFPMYQIIFSVRRICNFRINSRVFLSPVDAFKAMRNPSCLTCTCSRGAPRGVQLPFHLSFCKQTSCASSHRHNPVFTISAMSFLFQMALSVVLTCVLCS